MSQFWTELSIVIFIIFLGLYFYFTRKFNHWKNKNVPFLPPIPFFGNALKLFTWKQSIGEFTRSLHLNTKGPYIGFFIADEPYLLVRDPELIKNILVKDFNTFPNRSVHNNQESDPMGSSLLFLMKTPDWREIRRKLTPVFTSGKMKNMYQLLNESAEDMVGFLEKEVKKNPIIDARDVASKYTTDAITSTAFGLRGDSFVYEESDFRAVSKRIFNWNVWERAFSTSCYFVAPNIIKFFKLRFVDKESCDFVRGVFWKVMNERQEKKFVRNDLLDILIELIKNEQIDDPYKLEGEKLVAQALQFFIGGYETTASTISFTLYELAADKEIQETLRREIMEVAEKHGGISYQSLIEMPYLESCVKETLRKYPILPFLDRRCNEHYQIPGSDVVLEKGTPIFISNWGFHFDPEYFPDPYKYDPLRFTEENLKNIPPFIYMPFGEGPRNCIGARFGTVSSKSGVAHIISNFEVELCEKTDYPLKLDEKGFLLAPLGGLPLRFKKL